MTVFAAVVTGGRRVEWKKTGIQMLVRNEEKSDSEAITEVTVAAFETLAISNHTEQYIVGALRAANALNVSMVAEVEGRIVGHIAFSPVTISDGSVGWYGVGPLSVLPELQRQGIGKALVQEGLARLKALGAEGCVLVGKPGYYQRFGFRNLPQLVLEGVPQEYFLALPLGETKSKGEVVFHQAFSATE